MERDGMPSLSASLPTNFNPRAPHGARHAECRPVMPRWAFQSTRSAWSATKAYSYSDNLAIFQSTRSAWSATCASFASTPASNNFNPRAPHGARRAPPLQRRALVAISIHALRMERDGSQLRRSRRHADFNPRAPHGARPSRRKNLTPKRNFNPRAPHGARRSAPMPT